MDCRETSQFVLQQTKLKFTSSTMETFFYRDSKTSFEFAAFYVGVALFALRVTHFSFFKEMSREFHLIS
jgi:hypothetical protein